MMMKGAKLPSGTVSCSEVLLISIFPLDVNIFYLYYNKKLYILFCNLNILNKLGTSTNSYNSQIS